MKGKVTLCKEKRKYIHLSSNSTFFENYVLVIMRGDALIFRVADLDDRRARKATKNKNGYYHFTLNLPLEIGTFSFDEEESNEDEVVIYCVKDLYERQ